MKNKQKEKEINCKASIYFFDPYKSRDEYRLAYKNNLPGRYQEDQKNGCSFIRYAPLYYMRREILFLIGKLDKFNEIEFYPIITSIVIIWATIEGLVVDLHGFNIKELKNKQSKEYKEFKNKLNYFMKNYMNLRNYEIDSLVRLRNNLIHNFYKLISRDENGEKISFKIDEHNSIVSNKIIHRVNNQGKKYNIREIKIDPWKYYESFEKGISKLKKDVFANGTNERRLFAGDNISTDTWMMVPE